MFASFKEHNMSNPVTIHEIQVPLEVISPMGKGLVWLVKDYGLEMDTMYSVIISEGSMEGMIFDFPNSDIKATKNYSLGRGAWKDLKTKISARDKNHHECS